MTTQEVVKIIRSGGKHYLDVMPVSTYYNTLSRISNGTAKPSTIINFFAKFGYTFKEELTWIKKS